MLFCIWYLSSKNCLLVLNNSHSFYFQNTSKGNTSLVQHACHFFSMSWWAFMIIKVVMSITQTQKIKWLSVH